MLFIYVDLIRRCWRACGCREPAVDFQSAKDGGTVGKSDPEGLALAAREGRVLVFMIARPGRLMGEAAMTITLELPPETEASLSAQAVARGLTLDAYLRSIIAQQVAASPVPAQRLDEQGMDRAIDDVFDAVLLPEGVGQGAMERANWYR